MLTRSFSQRITADHLRQANRTWTIQIDFQLSSSLYWHHLVKMLDIWTFSF